MMAKRQEKSAAKCAGKPDKMSRRSKALLQEDVVGRILDWGELRENVTSWLRRREVCGAKMAFEMRIAVKNLYRRQ